MIDVIVSAALSEGGKTAANFGTKLVFSFLGSMAGYGINTSINKSESKKWKAADEKMVPTVEEVQSREFKRAVRTALVGAACAATAGVGCGLVAAAIENSGNDDKEVI